MSVKATLNRCIFRIDLKFSRDNTFLISAGNLFLKVVFLKVVFHKVVFHNVGGLPHKMHNHHMTSAKTCNGICVDDLSFQDDLLMDGRRFGQQMFWPTDYFLKIGRFGQI